MDSSYEDGKRDGRLASLEHSHKLLMEDLRKITDDLGKMKVMMYMLYGAIALVQFLPELRAFLNGSGS